MTRLPLNDTLTMSEVFLSDARATSKKESPDILVYHGVTHFIPPMLHLAFFFWIAILVSVLYRFNRAVSCF